MDLNYKIIAHLFTYSSLAFLISPSLTLLPILCCCCLLLTVYENQSKLSARDRHIHHKSVSVKTYQLWVNFFKLIKREREKETHELLIIAVGRKMNLCQIDFISHIYPHRLYLLRRERVEKLKYRTQKFVFAWKPLITIHFIMDFNFIRKALFHVQDIHQKNRTALYRKIHDNFSLSLGLLLMIHFILFLCSAFDLLSIWCECSSKNKNKRVDITTTALSSSSNPLL